ncbi:MAG: hypothetical protein Q9174_001994 [Haloplaca sp. 1 TL-2023]
MLIDGEKWACEACVRGHRVSNCQHSGKLSRGLRKARASHVKCDCGEKPHRKEDCVADARPQSSHSEASAENPVPTATSETKTCCCTHGSRCTCALKKEYLDSVPETGLPKTSGSLRSKKPKLQATNSDSSIAHFSNNHHKPIHKYNDAHNHMGAPYRVPIPHSIRGNRDVPRKSTDSLPLAQSLDYTPSPFQDMFTFGQQDLRQVRSEQGSPQPKSMPRFSGLDSPLPPLDLSYSYTDPVGSPLPNDYFTDPYPPRKNFDPYLPLNDDAPVISPGFSMRGPDEFGSLDFSLAHASPYSEPQSHQNFEPNYVARPPLTTSSSGEISDLDDYMPRNAAAKTLVGHSGIPHSALDDISHGDTHHSDIPHSAPEGIPHSTPQEIPYNMPEGLQHIAPEDLYRQTTSPNYLSSTPSDILSSESPNSLDMEEYVSKPAVPKTTASPGEFEDAGAHMNSDKFTKHGLTVQDVQKLAHPSPPTNEMGDLNLPVKSEVKKEWTDEAELADPWSTPFEPAAPFGTEDQKGDVWASDNNDRFRAFDGSGQI